MWVYKESLDHLSIHETVCHLADVEVSEYVYCRCLIADPDSPVVGIDSLAWSRSPGYLYEDVKEAMGIIRALRRFTYHLLKMMPEASWTCAAELPIHSGLSLDEWLETRESYFPEHIRQMKRTYSNWLETTSTAKAVTSARKTLSSESFVLRQMSRS